MKKNTSCLHLLRVFVAKNGGDTLVVTILGMVQIVPPAALQFHVVNVWQST